MHSRPVTETSLTASDFSYIVNLICPRCGGPLGGALTAFTCQGRCRKDWRPEWEAAVTARMLNKSQRRRRTPKKFPGRISSRRHPWRGSRDRAVSLPPAERAFSIATAWKTINDSLDPAPLERLSSKLEDRTSLSASNRQW